MKANTIWFQVAWGRPTFGTMKRATGQSPAKPMRRCMVALALTNEGRKVTESFLPRVVELYNSLLADFTADEADTLIDLLTRLTSKLSEPSVPMEG